MSNPDKKHHKKKQARITPYDDPNDKYNYKTNFQPFENFGYDNENEVVDFELEKINNKPDILNKFRSAAETATYTNAISMIANVKQGASRWRQYASSKRSRLKKVDSVDGSPASGEAVVAVQSGIDRRAPGGMGLADVEDDFRMEKSTSHQMIVASNRTLLQYFAKLGSGSNCDESIDLDFVESLFKNGARIDCTDKYGQTIFHEVARAWHIDVAKFLIENGGDPNVADNYGRTPLHVASAVDYDEMVQFLIQNKAFKEARTKGEQQTPVHYAAKNDACQALKMLVKLKCEYKDVRDYKKRTPIQLAAELDRSETAHLLLELAAPVGVQDDSGQPAIVWMITKMAPVAKDALNQFHVTDRANRKQYYFLNHLEPQPPKDLVKRTHAQTALEVITSHRQFDLVTHEAVKRLIHVKWKKFGKFGAWFNLIFSLVFIMLWTILGVIPDWKLRYKYNLPTDIWRIILWVAAVVLTQYQIVAEVLEYKSSKKKHEDWKKWREAEIDRDLNYCHPRWPEEKEFLLQEKSELDKVAPQYFNDAWNIFDWVCYVLLLTCIITHIVDVAAHSIELARAHIRVMSVNIILLWLRLMKNARAFATLGPFIAMLGHMMNDVFRFLFLYLEFYIPFLCAFWMVFGGKNTTDSYLKNPPPPNSTVETDITIDGYGQFYDLIFSLFRLTLVDDYPFAEMQSVDPIMSVILLMAWFSLSAILCLNLFIALLSDTFQRVYDNAQANSIMQKAMTIMNNQESLTKRRRNAIKKYIHQNCAPEILYYDDDMATTGETDLKKVAFQVKDELELLREWFHAKFGPIEPMAEHEAATLKQSDRNLTVEVLETEIDFLRSEIQNLQVHHEDFKERYKQDTSMIKSLLEEILFRQGRERGGGGGALRQLEPLEPSYSRSRAPVREEDKRTRRERKERKKKLKGKESDEPILAPDEDAAVELEDDQPTIELSSMGHVAAEPPPPEISGSFALGEPNTSDA